MFQFAHHCIHQSEKRGQSAQHHFNLGLAFVKIYFLFFSCAGCSAALAAIKDALGKLKLFGIVFIYSLLGAWLFMWLEIPTDIAAKEEAYHYHLIARDVLLFK